MKDTAAEAPRETAVEMVLDVNFSGPDQESLDYFQASLLNHPENLDISSKTSPLPKRAAAQDFPQELADRLNDREFEAPERQVIQEKVQNPPVLCGENKGANPVEYLLVALSGCLTTSLVAHAAAKDIILEKISSRYEGDLDLRGFLGLSEEVPVGYQSIRVYFTIEADISKTQKEDLVQMAQKYSPVYNTITRGTPVSVHLEK